MGETASRRTGVAGSMSLSGLLRQSERMGLMGCRPFTVSPFRLLLDSGS